MLMGLHRGEDSTLSQVEEVLANDGKWHHLQLDISSLGGAAGHHKAVLSFDHGLYLVRRRCTKKDGKFTFCELKIPGGVCVQARMEVDGKLRDSKLKTVSIGGLAGPDGKIQMGFRGCIQVSSCSQLRASIKYWLYQFICESVLWQCSMSISSVQPYLLYIFYTQSFDYTIIPH